MANSDSNHAERGRVLRGAADELRASLELEVVPLLISWYVRCRRARAMDDACTVAAHLAFAYSAIADSAADASQRSTPESGAGGLEQLPLFALLSSRVLINVHHDFGIEPHTGLAAAPKRRRS